MSFPSHPEELKRQSAALEDTRVELDAVQNQLALARSEIETIKAVATVSENTKQEAIDQIRSQWQEEVASLQAIMKGKHGLRLEINMDTEAKIDGKSVKILQVRVTPSRKRGQTDLLQVFRRCFFITLWRRGETSSETSKQVQLILLPPTFESNRNQNMNSCCFQETRQLLKWWWWWRCF